jgi:hypothetical protein
MPVDHNEKRSCGCVILHRRVYVCERHAQLPEALRDKISQMGSKVMAEEIDAARILGRKEGEDVARKAIQYLRWVIGNRGCVCNAPRHRCGTNNMLEDAARLEEQLS